MQSAIIFLLTTTILWGLAGPAGIEESPHSFSYWPEQTEGGCLTCHHPHRPTAEVPRWQMPLERSRGFALYKSAPGLPSQSTLMCLSCHDGAVADEIHLADDKITVSQIGRSTAMISQRVKFPLGSHPVAVRYDQGNEKMVPRATVEADKRIRLPNGRVECISCHDPHGTGGYEHLLVKSNKRSALCLSCHRL